MLPTLALLLTAVPAAVPATPPEFSREPSRILRQSCQSCHRPGGAGPFDLLTSADARRHAATIREAVAERRMPPWYADPRYGRWANDRSLSAADRQTLLGWLDAGCPDQAPPESPTVAASADGWRIKPDVVFELPAEQNIPAAGQVPYRFVHVPTAFAEDRWVQAVEVRPGNRRVVHHVLVFAPLPGTKAVADPAKAEVTNGMLASYLPGDEPLALPDGYAKRLPAGSPLVFQLHYTPTGRPETDRSAVGLVFAKEPPAYEVKSLNVEAQYFTIPPRAADFRVEATRAFYEDVELLALSPHMHLRGKDFTYTVTRPGQPPETLLSVPRYDFNWQTSYKPAEPITLPAGTLIECVAHYDNSADNPNNPDPNKEVVYGEMTEQEMMIGFVEYAGARVKKKRRELAVTPVATLKPPPPPAARPPGAGGPWILASAVGAVLALSLVLRRRRNPLP